MDAGLVLALALALAFAVTNGLHDASNAIATLVATRAARPRHALALAALFNLLGPLLVGAGSLRVAFVTPLDPEDLFALSRGIDWILNHAKDAIGESEVMRCPPDGATAAMAELLAQSVHHIDEAVARIADRSGDASDFAHAAVKAERRLEKTYRAAMGALTELDDLRAVMGRQELYRRCSRMGETAVDVAERLIYAELKEN